MYEFELVESDVPDSLVLELSALEQRVFGNSDIDSLRWRVGNMPDVTVFLARHGQRLAGFKAGYAVTDKRYYSWLGGVDPSHQRRGLASALMQRQHDWLGQCGYRFVETHVRRDNTGMIQVNLDHGFDVVGMFLKSDRPNLIMRRMLPGELGF